MSMRIETEADKAVRACLTEKRSFALIAGAGSGKTASLVDALLLIREDDGARLRRNGQQIACITFTKRAVEVIRARVDFDSLYHVSTLHSFLWAQIGRFQRDIREALKTDRLPVLIAKEQARDNGGNSRTALDARNKAARLQDELAQLDVVKQFEYSDAPASHYAKGQISHDDVIAIATWLLRSNATFRRILGLRYPYLLVDEAQDTFAGIIEGLNLVCVGSGLPLVGYFGDPWQQIYDSDSSTFAPPPGGETITKTENFRCSKSVIRLLNAFRNDVEQYAAGNNRNLEGSVIFRLVKAEKPAAPRNRYSEEQTSRALLSMDTALQDWGWQDRKDIVQLFLVRQMIARRMGFSSLNRLFTGTYASSRAEKAFEAGEHYLLQPLLHTVLPLIAAQERGDSRRVIDLLRHGSPAYAVDGPNSARSLSSVISASRSDVISLRDQWMSGNFGQILRFAQEHRLIQVSDRLRKELARPTRTDEYDDAVHSLDKGDWLADALFAMTPSELPAYHSFISENTAFSTQHGVKGEEYRRVLVVYDDIEANWNNYSFGRILTPTLLGQPTEGQFARTRKLSYVSFSRALEDLRVLFFTPDPEAAKQELITGKLVKPAQIEIVS